MMIGQRARTRTKSVICPHSDLATIIEARHPGRLARRNVHGVRHFEVMSAARMPHRLW
jgi:hypothetical protein